MPSKRKERDIPKQDSSSSPPSRRRSERNQHDSLEQVLKSDAYKCYFKRPEYSEDREGRQTMTVILNSSSGDRTCRGSSTSGTEGNSVLEGLRGIWVRGHMLNADLGGPGILQNYIALRGTANSQHSGYEKRVKGFCEWAKQLERDKTSAKFKADFRSFNGLQESAESDAPEYRYGLLYTVEVKSLYIKPGP